MKNNSKTFLVVNFGCRVNAAETNQYSQSLVDLGYIPDSKNPNIIFINTCSVTKKGEYESISQIKRLSKKFPDAQIIATGCANLTKIESLKNLKIIDKDNLLPSYTHQIKDKFSHTDRYLLKIQSGCSQFCTYCIVPFKRKTLWSLSISNAVDTVDQAIKDGYTEVIITGINIDLYQYGLSELVLSLLKNTSVPLISFGSIPLNRIDDRFIKLFQQFPGRLSHFLHIPIQSGSDKILKLMHRPYNIKKITEIFPKLKQIGGFSFGTDIIVGFPGETESDFQKTLNLCRSVGFFKIHVFKFSPRPRTAARELFLNSPKISKMTLTDRSQQIRSLISQTTLPSHQTLGI